MVEYATLSDLRRFSQEMLSEQRTTTLRKSAARDPRGSTFLSHSSSDSELLPGVIALLENHGASVYIDKMDNTLPPQTSSQTAKALRSRIEQSNCFILLATSRSKNSLWIPWELGLADGLKRSRRVAILPGVDTAAHTDWPNQEYLGIYDKIAWGEMEGHAGNLWMVWNPVTNTADTLSRWLKHEN